MVERLGVFGGSFDPFHRGHLRMAREAKKQMRLDRLLFVPSYEAPHRNGKRNTASVWDRCAMTVLGAAVGGKSFAVSFFEMERGKKTYTIELLSALQKRSPRRRLIFLMGLDSLLDLRTWKSARSLVRRFPLAVFRRPDYALNKDVLPSFIRASLTPSGRVEGETGIFLLRNRPSSVSASALRDEIGRRGMSARARRALPANVARYIASRGLYQKSNPDTCL